MIAKRVQARQVDHIPIHLPILSQYTTTKLLELGANVSDHEGVHIHKVETDFGVMHLCVQSVEDLTIA